MFDIPGCENVVKTKKWRLTLSDDEDDVCRQAETCPTPHAHPYSVQQRERHKPHHTPRTQPNTT